jgi:hypothetical protein
VRWNVLLALTSATPAVFADPKPTAQAPVQTPAPSPAEVVPPRLLGTAEVAYPEGASGDAIVILLLVIAPDGTVRSATPEQEVPPFSEHAARAAAQFRFEPATRDGRAVAAKIRLEVRFVEPRAPAASAEPPREPESKAPVVPGIPKALAPPAPPLEVLVRGERPEPSRTATLSRAEVREIPGTFGDPFRAVETLPGVTPIVSGLPFFFVRGAPPGNVGYFLDGVRVPLLFHVGAGPSVVNPGLMDRVDLYPASYPARFGRFAGGIVAGETLEPSSELRGEFNLRLFDAGGLVEAPFADGRATVLLGGRYSYTALALSALSPETVLAYWDYQGRATYALTARDRIGVFAFGSYDFVGERGATEQLTLFGTEFHRVDVRYDRKLDAGRLRTAFTLGLDTSRLQAQNRSTRDRHAAARTEYESELSRDVRVRFGTDFVMDEYDIVLGQRDLSPSAARAARYYPSRVDVAGGVRGDVVLALGPRYEVTPGIRVDAYGSDGKVALAIEPRLGWRVGLNARSSLLGSAGIAHQAPSFVVPVPGFQPGGLAGGLQRALQHSLGVELNLGSGTTATASVFQNAFFSMSDPLGATEPTLSGCAPGAYPTDTLGGDSGARLDLPPYCGPRFEPGTLGPDRSGGGGQAADSRAGRRVANAFEVRTLGSAYGFEFYLKRRLTQRIGGFLSYTLSRSTRSYERRRYVASFDRTHVANGAVAYDLGRAWRAGTRLVFYTGLPKIADPRDPEDTRLPPFFRVDLRLEKRWQLGRKTHLSFVAEWMNATLAKEAVTTRCTLDGCEAQMIGPVTIPSIGLEGGF